jgi:hypothetical protein
MISSKMHLIDRLGWLFGLGALAGLLGSSAGLLIG